jgi:hypothetical protein
MQQYYEIQITLRGSHTWEEYRKGQKLKNLKLVDVLTKQE